MTIQELLAEMEERGDPWPAIILDEIRGFQSRMGAYPTHAQWVDNGTGRALILTAA